MAATSVGLYYSRATGRLRWVMVPDADSQLVASANPGEALLIIARADYQKAVDVAGLQALVAAQTKNPPVGDRSAVVDDAGSVIATVFIDPACGDKAPLGATFVQTDAADIGWTFLGGIFVAPPPVASTRIIGSATIE